MTVTRQTDRHVDRDNVVTIVKLAPVRNEFDFGVPNVTRRVHDDPTATATIDACEMSSSPLRGVNSLSRDRLCFSCQAWREQCKLVDLKLELCRANAFALWAKGH